ncbi:hypothetical protein [Stakelama pacifica]|nr:hypothetical protein [Stakelama pacifica]
MLILLTQRQEEGREGQGRTAILSQVAPDRMGNLSIGDAARL